MKFQAIVQISHEDHYHYPSHWYVGDKPMGPRRETVEEATADFIGNRSPEMERNHTDEGGEGHGYCGYYIRIFTDEDLAREEAKRQKEEELKRQRILNPPPKPKASRPHLETLRENFKVR